MAKTKKKTTDKGAGMKAIEEIKILKEATEHFSDSDTYVETFRTTWDDKEAIMVGGVEDELSQNTTKSKVFDPRLSTIVQERVARVMSQNPTGKAYAISKDDIGKNRFMNLLLDKYVAQNANYQFDYLIKDRLWDYYSQIYGTMFGMVDWVNDERAKYFGPNFWILPIRDCFPQPGVVSIEDSDWFQVSNLKSIDWLESRPKDTWKNIDELLLLLKDTKGKTNEDKDSERRTYRERTSFPSVPGDAVFPQVEIITEYRRDRWITYAPDHALVLRDIPNPHKNEKLPVTAKHCFPLLDSIYGLGEVERGQTLQLAINSLINLYLDGVKMSIFPPIQINPNAQGLVPSSIKFGAAEKWLVGRPNVDIQQMQLSPQGMNTFQSTYQFLTAALLNQAGTTDTTVSKEADITQGKTPQALRMVQQRENSRDNWDRFMMERALERRNKLFIELLTEKMEKPVSLRLFGKEIEEIAQDHPDVVEMFNSRERGRATITKKAIEAKYDYEIEPMSTMQKEPGEELKSVQSLLAMFMRNPQILQLMAQQSQQLGRQPMTVDMTELVKKSIVLTGIQDWEKVLVEMNENTGSPLPQDQNQAPPDPVGDEGQMNFNDPQIQQAAQQMFASLGGIGGVPINNGQQG